MPTLCAFIGLDELKGMQFWVDLYTHGKLGDSGVENTLILLVFRLALMVAIFGGAQVAIGLFHRLIRRGLDAIALRTPSAKRRMTTLYSLLASATAYVTYFFAVLLMLFVLGVTWKGLAPLLGAASVLGLAVGFGAQKLVKDIITGLFILGEGQFDVGDWVTINNVSGRVEEIGLRVTRVRDDEGRLYIIANGDITSVFNASRGAVKLSIDLPIQRTGTLDAALAIIHHAVETTLNAHLDEGKDFTLHLAGIGAAQCTVRVTLWVPIAKRATIENALRRALLDDATLALA